MSKQKSRTRAQHLFLRQVTKDPFAVNHKEFPSAVIFRRWMRKPGFRVAIAGVRDALRLQADLHLAAAAAAAAQTMAKTIACDEPLVARENLKDARDQIASLMQLLRLAHLRQRFSMDIPTPPGRINLSPQQTEKLGQLREYLQLPLKDHETIGEARELVKLFDELVKARQAGAQTRPASEESEQPDAMD